MSLLLRSARKLQKISPLNSVAAYSAHGHGTPGQPYPIEATYDQELIGNREVVGFGMNGRPHYIDRPDFPLPAIRWRPVTPDIKALREKEKGDWKKLTIEEKKQLYRASFCQTFAEMNAPSGEWKSILGFTLFYAGIGLWLFMALTYFVYPERPVTFTLERKQAQMQRMIDMAVNPIEGLASKWDYEKNDWKK